MKGQTLKGLYIHNQTKTLRYSHSDANWGFYATFSFMFL